MMLYAEVGEPRSRISSRVTVACKSPRPRPGRSNSGAWACPPSPTGAGWCRSDQRASYTRSHRAPGVRSTAPAWSSEQKEPLLTTTLHVRKLLGCLELVSGSYLSYPLLKRPLFKSLQIWTDHKQDHFGLPA